jgi:DNA-binding transcriptional LysR family regulator
MVARLSREFPETLIDLRADLIEPSKPLLMRGEIDIIAGALNGAAPDGIVIRRLMSAEVVVFAGPRNPLYARDAVALRDALPFPWTSFQHDSFTERRIERAFSDLLLPTPRVTVVADSIEACFEIVAASQALTAAAHPVTPLAEARGLRRLPLPEPLWRFESGLWLRESSLEYPVIVRAVEILEELCAGAP